MCSIFSFQLHPFLLAYLSFLCTLAISKFLYKENAGGILEPLKLKRGFGFEVNGLDWHCCLAGSSKTAPRIFIFSNAIGADYSYEMKNSEIWAPSFFKPNNSFIAAVYAYSVPFFGPVVIFVKVVDKSVSN